MTGRQVVMSGFATPAENGNWYLTRMTLVCCAAGARAAATRSAPQGRRPSQRLVLD